MESSCALRPPNGVRVAVWIMLLLSSPCLIAADSEAENKAEGAADPADAALQTIAVHELRQTRADPAPSEAVAPAQLDEIVVTATKRRSVARDLPASVDAYGGEALEASGAQGIDDFARFSPGVNLTNDGFSAQRVTIRGVSSDLGTNLTVGTFLGDIPFSEPYFPRIALDPNPFDLGSVEILKGPQGTLFGGSALNGAIRYLPRQPDFGVSEGKYFLQYATVNEGGAAPVFGAVVNVPLGDRDDLAVRAMAFRRRMPGFVDSTHPDRQQEDINTLAQSGARAILAWQATGSTAVRLTWMTQRTQTADLPTADNDEERLENATLIRPSAQANEYTLGGLTLEHGFERFDLVSESAWIGKAWIGTNDLARVTGGQTGGLFAYLDNESDAWSQELRLVSTDGGDWTWVAGAFGFEYTLLDTYDAVVENAAIPAGLLGPAVGLPLTNNVASDGGSVLASRVVADIKVSELALFGEVTRRLFDRLEASLGLRAFSSQSGGTVDMSGPLLFVSTGPSGGRETVQGVIKERGVNPRASLRFEFDEQRSVFLSGAKGFRFGGINQVRSTDGMSPEFYRSDELWSYELGWRSQWLDRSLQFDATAIYVDWSDPQVFQTDPVSQVSYVDNAGGVRSKGLEVALQYLPPIDGLSLRLSAARIDTRLTEPFTTALGTPRAAGDPWALAPELQTAASVRYSLPISRWQFDAAFSHTYLSEAYGNLEYRDSEVVFGYGTYDLQLSLARLDATYLPTIGLIVTNLTDERGVVSASQPIPTYHDVGYATPRTITLRVGGTF